jgi:pimeloyl-ACP methyl ester carboxylesterase
MARKFLYLVAVLIVLYIGGRLALQFYPDQLSRLAFVPTAQFTPQPKFEPSVYDDPEMWISRPGMGESDPARWLPEGASRAPQPVCAAVFFVHPTLADAQSRALAETFVRGMASPFGDAAQLWAPRYREATIGAFLTDTPAAQQALALAYGDVVQAFDHFIAKTDPNTPIVLVGHSQGARHLLRLLRDRGAGLAMSRKVVAIYLIGWPVSWQHDLSVSDFVACRTPEQTNCVVSWQSFGEPADPGMVQRAYDRELGLDGKPLKGSPFVCTNPLTGALGGSTPASANLGTLVPDVAMSKAVLRPHMLGASCRADGFLSLGSAPNLGPYVLPGNNYHVYDIPLFWANLRADFTRRAAAWKS